MYIKMNEKKGHTKSKATEWKEFTHRKQNSLNDRSTWNDETNEKNMHVMRIFICWIFY